MSKIRKSARGEDCTVRIPGVCNFNPETTILAHANSSAAGKGARLKANDALSAYACSSCHDVIDGRVKPPRGMSFEAVQLAFHEGHQRTFLILIAKGLVKIT